jgi:hypothetical protein
LNGTVVSAPHCEQVVRVSGLELPPLEARFALQFLHRLGSFLNCLSWKKSCSPAVKTKSLPQSAHFKTLSTKSIPRPLRLTQRSRQAAPAREWPVVIPDLWLLEDLKRGPGRSEMRQTFDSDAKPKRHQTHDRRNITYGFDVPSAPAPNT